MAPPPRPQQAEMDLTRRPSARRSKTYHSQEVPSRQHVSYEPEQYNQEDESNGYREHRTSLSTVRERRASPSRPPTSYRAPAVIEARDRPSLPKKSVSYNATPTTTTKVASSRAHVTARKPTLLHMPLEDKETAVEEYIKRSSKTSNELTAEALRNLNHGNSSSRSETASSYSHKSRQSSSKESSGPGKSQTTNATKTSITLPGGLNMSIPSDYITPDGRPLSINVGGLIVLVGADEKDSVERIREQRRIERAPSVASRASKRSASSSISNRDKERGRDGVAQSARRPSQVDDRGPSVRSSRQPSQAPSTGEGSYEHSRRQSVDYGRSFEEVIYGA
ncbi:hypothetical protein A1O3_06488 [Capronia epimyces CBS 606.96]|uniref:Uncharacterized protein n=1 Tax=Capronia epimyces CBS 606.96 TaxID=1182542 RepID=W9YK80_9EURO|nr:uncharacterized protein A1O3_06488 [Capronia epimyces CBS 606.96]EXJ82674.1 hypothetical protein A1O3_06488 [Capronia epimyces CBS 606.96]